MVIIFVTKQEISPLFVHNKMFFFFILILVLTIKSLEVILSFVKTKLPDSKPNIVFEKFLRSSK